MKIILTGGGSGGHITPLLAVARELKKLDSSVEIIGICEKNAKFKHLFEEEKSISAVYEIRAGKYRRYSGMSRLSRMLDVPTFARNVRDVGRVCKGYTEARKLLKRLRPNGILIKGGFVGVPVGLAASHLSIPFITHDSDSKPGLANRIIARWARKHATGMPEEFYAYPKGSMVYTGVPVAPEFKQVTAKQQAEFREKIGLGDCNQVIAVIGGSQGGSQLNEDIASIIGRLMEKNRELGLVHIAGHHHDQTMLRRYAQELLADERRRIIVKAFVPDVYRYTGAADVVISRASATVVAELAVQGKAVILVPGKLADDHQTTNAKHLADSSLALQVPFGDREGLHTAASSLLNSKEKREKLASSLHRMAKPDAARDLAMLLMNEFRAGKRSDS